MSTGALLITLLNPPRDALDASAEDARTAAPLAARPPTPGTTPGARAVVSVPAFATAGEVGPDALQSRARRLGAALVRCAAQPAGFAPADGRLDLVVELGASGLEGAFVDGLPSLGAGAEGCLAAALGASAWPSAEPPTAVRVPFYVVQPVGRADPNRAAPGAPPAGAADPVPAVMEPLRP